PKVRVFSTSMDLLFALPENRHIMRGVVISTTYPLHPPNQEWTSPDGNHRHNFQSQSSQGYYNATVFNLAGDVRNEDGEVRINKGEVISLTGKDILGRLAEYGPPVTATSTNRTRPPIWIVTMGENGHLVPFGFFTSKA